MLQMTKKHLLYLALYLKALGVDVLRTSNPEKNTIGIVSFSNGEKTDVLISKENNEDQTIGICANYKATEEDWQIINEWQRVINLSHEEKLDQWDKVEKVEMHILDQILNTTPLDYTKYYNMISELKD